KGMSGFILSHHFVGRSTTKLQRRRVAHRFGEAFGPARSLRLGTVGIERRAISGIESVAVDQRHFFRCVPAFRIDAAQAKCSIAGGIFSSGCKKFLHFAFHGKCRRLGACANLKTSSNPMAPIVALKTTPIRPAPRLSPAPDNSQPPIKAPMIPTTISPIRP